MEGLERLNIEKFEEFLLVYNIDQSEVVRNVVIEIRERCGFASRYNVFEKFI